MTSRATLGEIKVAACPVCTNQGFKSLVPLPGVCDTYLYYQMLQNKDRYAALGIGSTFLEVNKRDTERFEIRVPPEIGVQRRIADVLATVDEAIEQTEALIAKTRQIKAGLMHDLFTRGVLPNGQLRPPREQAPELYQPSPLGWIPREWAFAVLGDCLRGNPKNGVYKPESAYGAAGIPIVRIDSFYDGRIVKMDSLKRLKLSDADVAAYGVAADDILINRVNSIEYIGKSAIVPKVLEPTVFESNVMRCRVDQATLLPGFAIRWLCWDVAARHFFTRAKSAIAQASINQSDVKSLPVGVPAIDEQRRVCVTAAGAECALDAQEQDLRVLIGLRTGLMHDLLTGRVRVPVREAPPTAAATV